MVYGEYFEDEDKVSYREGNEVRCLKGKIIFEDSNFVTLERRDGTYKIAVNLIEKIVYRKKR